MTPRVKSHMIGPGHPPEWRPPNSIDITPSPTNISCSYMLLTKKYIKNKSIIRELEVSKRDLMGDGVSIFQRNNKCSSTSRLVLICFSRTKTSVSTQIENVIFSKKVIFDW